MGVKQFINSLSRIQKNPHVSTIVGVTRHLLWQIRKAFNAFPFELRISQSRFIAQHRKCGISALIYNQGMYDWNNMHFLLEVAQRTNLRYFLDVGANIGVYSILLSEVPQLTVYAFEPHPVTFRYLEENIAINPGRAVCAEQSAVGNYDGTIHFTDDPGSAINRVLPSDENGGIVVPICRLDTFCRSRRITPDIVKIDVEGYELAVLEGLGEYLRSVAVLVLEVKHQSQSNMEKILSLLNGAGKHGPFWVDVDQKVLLSKQFGFEDPVFCSPQILAVLRESGWAVEAG